MRPNDVIARLSFSAYMDNSRGLWDVQVIGTDGHTRGRLLLTEALSFMVAQAARR